jgi:hypothetical protein
MKIIQITMASTAIVTLSATLAFAQGVETAAEGLTFDQGTMDINEVILERTVGGTDGIELSVSGDMTSVVIKQGGSVGGVANSAVVNIFASSAVTSVAGFLAPTTALGASIITDANRTANNSITDGNDWKTFSATFDGDGNKLTFNLGTAAVTTGGYGAIDVDLAVTGDSNTLTHNTTSGLAVESFQLGGIVNGNVNTVLTTIGAVGDVAFNYNIQGSRNNLTGTLSGATGGRTVDVALNGDDNVWTVTAGAVGGTVDVTATGSTITGTNTQGGTGSTLLLDIAQTAASPFAVTTTQTGANSYANVTINAAAGGAFTLTQSSANARYEGTLNIAAGGAVTITQ